MESITYKSCSFIMNLLPSEILLVAVERVQNKFQAQGFLIFSMGLICKVTGQGIKIVRAKIPWGLFKTRLFYMVRIVQSK